MNLKNLAFVLSLFLLFLLLSGGGQKRKNWYVKGE